MHQVVFLQDPRVVAIQGRGRHAPQVNLRLHTDCGPEAMLLQARHRLDGMPKGLLRRHVPEELGGLSLASVAARLITVPTTNGRNEKNDSLVQAPQLRVPQELYGIQHGI